MPEALVRRTLLGRPVKPLKRTRLLPGVSTGPHMVRQRKRRSRTSKEIIRKEAVSHEFRTALQQAIMARRMHGHWSDVTVTESGIRRVRTQSSWWKLLA